MWRMTRQTGRAAQPHGLIGTCEVNRCRFGGWAGSRFWEGPCIRGLCCGHDGMEWNEGGEHAHGRFCRDGAARGVRRAGVAVTSRKMGVERTWARRRIRQARCCCLLLHHQSDLTRHLDLTVCCETPCPNASPRYAHPRPSPKMIYADCPEQNLAPATKPHQKSTQPAAITMGAVVSCVCPPSP